MSVRPRAPWGVWAASEGANDDADTNDPKLARWIVCLLSAVRSLPCGATRRRNSARGWFHVALDVARGAACHTRASNRLPPLAFGTAAIAIGIWVGVAMAHRHGEVSLMIWIGCVITWLVFGLLVYVPNW
jgi:hypothetical protein